VASIRAGVRASCCACSVFPVEEVFEVQSDVGDANFGRGLLDADGADKQAHASFWAAKM